jgi:hypothetical protein
MRIGGAVTALGQIASQRGRGRRPPPSRLSAAIPIVGPFMLAPAGAAWRPTAGAMSFSSLAAIPSCRARATTSPRASTRSRSCTKSSQVYPVLPGLAFGVEKTPMWNTMRKRTPSGRSYRGTFQTTPRWRYKLTYEFLRDTAAFPELKTLASFFNA